MNNVIRSTQSRKIIDPLDHNVIIHIDLAIISIIIFSHLIFQINFNIQLQELKRLNGRHVHCLINITISNRYHIYLSLI